MKTIEINTRVIVTSISKSVFADAMLVSDPSIRAAILADAAADDNVIVSELKDDYPEFFEAVSSLDLEGNKVDHVYLVKSENKTMYVILTSDIHPLSQRVPADWGFSVSESPSVWFVYYDPTGRLDVDPYNVGIYWKDQDDLIAACDQELLKDRQYLPEGEDED